MLEAKSSRLRIDSLAHVTYQTYFRCSGHVNGSTMTAHQSGYIIYRSIKAIGMQTLIQITDPSTFTPSR